VKKVAKESITVVAMAASLYISSPAGSLLLAFVEFVSQTHHTTLALLPASTRQRQRRVFMSKVQNCNMLLCRRVPVCLAMLCDGNTKVGTHCCSKLIT